MQYNHQGCTFLRLPFNVFCPQLGSLCIYIIVYCCLLAFMDIGPRLVLVCGRAGGRAISIVLLGLGGRLRQADRLQARVEPGVGGLQPGLDDLEGTGEDCACRSTNTEINKIINNCFVFVLFIKCNKTIFFSHIIAVATFAIIQLFKKKQ